MRMDQEQGLTASEILNSYAQEDLEKIFRENGEIVNSRQLVREIISNRSLEPIENTQQLRNISLKTAPRGKENQYLAKVFQAIRIEVNDEIGSLKEMIRQATDLLNPGGRLVIISYHSLEDRIVKNYFRYGNFEGVPVKDFFGKQIAPLLPVIRKAIVPEETEQINNPRSRSAKLRIAEKTENA